MHRHRHHRPDLPEPAERLGAGHQPAAQPTGDGGQDDVVDGAAVGVAHRAVLGQGPSYGHEAALLRERAADRGVLLGAPVRERVDHGPDASGGGIGTPPHRAAGAADGVECGVRRADGVADRLEQQSRRRLGTPRPPVVGAELAALRRPVEQDLGEVDDLRAVDQRLVRLGEHRDAAALEALDEVDLPQRPVTVERSGDDPRDELTELVHRPGAGQGGAAYVVAEVEVRVVDPDRVREVAGHPADPLAVARHERDPVGDQLNERVVVEARRAGVEDLDRGVVHRRRRGLGGQEGQIARPQPLAHPPPCASSRVPPWDSGRASEADLPGPSARKDTPHAPTGRGPHLSPARRRPVGGLRRQQLGRYVDRPAAHQGHRRHLHRRLGDTRTAS